MTWLARLKNLKAAPTGTDKTDETPQTEVLSVLAVPPPGVSEKSQGRPVLHPERVEQLVPPVAKHGRAQEKAFAADTAKASGQSKHDVNRPVLHFRLPGYAPNTWATAIGRPGETVESLRADLADRWPGVEVGP